MENIKLNQTVPVTVTNPENKGYSKSDIDDINELREIFEKMFEWCIRRPIHLEIKVDVNTWIYKLDNSKYMSVVIERDAAVHHVFIDFETLPMYCKIDPKLMDLRVLNVSLPESDVATSVLIGDAYKKLFLYVMEAATEVDEPNVRRECFQAEKYILSGKPFKKVPPITWFYKSMENNRLSCWDYDYPTFWKKLGSWLFDC